VEIYSYNDHRSAPFSRAWWLALAPPTLPGRGSRHCHGINCAHDPVNECYGDFSPTERIVLQLPAHLAQT